LVLWHHGSAETRLTAGYEPFEETRLTAGCEPFEETRLTAGYEPFEETRLTAGYEPFEETRLTAGYEPFELGWRSYRHMVMMRSSWSLGITAPEETRRRQRGDKETRRRQRGDKAETARRQGGDSEETERRQGWRSYRHMVMMRSTWALGITAPEGFPGLHITTWC